MKKYEGKINKVKVTIETPEATVSFLLPFANVFTGTSNSGNPKIQVNGIGNVVEEIDGVLYQSPEKFHIQMNLSALSAEAQRLLKNLTGDVVRKKADGKEVTL